MPEQQEEEEEEVCEAGSGQDTSGQPPLHLSHSLEPLLQGGSINHLVEDWDFIVLLGGGRGDRSGRSRSQEEKDYSCRDCIKRLELPSKYSSQDTVSKFPD